MQPEVIAILCVFLGFALLEMRYTRFFRKPGQTRDDGLVELISTGTLALLTQPFVLFAGGYVASLVAPESAGSLTTLPVIAQIGLLLVFDDMLQYWWHRLTHQVPWLYNLHRAHHNAAYLSIRVVYRNNVFYYLLMPSLWLSGAMIYLGLGWIYAFYLVAKLTVITAAHCDVRWDAPLYRIKWLSPVMWVVERTISTPSTHAAHHGKFKSDPATHYKGNFGNLLFFWDVLFGTAKITRRYPKQMGVENLHEATLSQQLFWPLTPMSIGSKQPAEADSEPTE